MCLSRVSDRYEPPMAERIVYKLFKRCEDGSLRFTVYLSTKVKFGKWLTAKEKVAGYGKHKYQSGFHAYATQKAADDVRFGNKIVLPVLFKDITSRGHQNGKSVYVARKMLILMPPPGDQNETSK